LIPVPSLNMSHLTETASSPLSRNWSIMFIVLTKTWYGSRVRPVHLATGYQCCTAGEAHSSEV
jgi:hypothetical protein